MDVSVDILITFGIILFGIFLFFKEYFSIDTTAILIMALFIVTGVLSPEEGFSGFNHPATITVGCMFVVSAAIFKTGILNGFSQALIRAGRRHYLLSIVMMIGFASVLSAFINDTAVVAMFLPVAMQVAKETKTSPSMYLMPLSFGALLGGVNTLVGTSTNILVSGIAKEEGMEPLGMFEFTGASIWLSIAGVAYLLTLGRWLLPKRKATEETELSEAVNEYITEIKVLPGTPDVDERITDSSLSETYDAEVVQIKRNEETFRADPKKKLQADDKLRIMISPEQLVKLRADKNYSSTGEEKRKSRELETSDEKIYEVLIPYGSKFAGKSLDDLKFRQEYGAIVLGIRSREDIILEDFANVNLRHGDLLLLLANEEAMEQISEEGDFIIVSHYEEKKKTDYKKAALAVAIAAGIISAAALNITDIVISAMVGCVLLILTGVINPKEAYKAVEWPVIFMLAGVLSMGVAIEKTGGADLIGKGIESGLGGYDPRITLGFIFLITFMATNIMSNNASAALMVPIVISTSEAMGLNARPFIIAVMFAASLSFMTPMGYQTNAMIYSPGNYRFRDYLRVGTPLNIIIWIIATLIIPLYFPFH